MAKEGQASRLLLRVQLQHPASTGSLHTMLQLCSGAGLSSSRPSKLLAAAAGPAAAAAGAASCKVRVAGDRGTQGPKAQAGLGDGSADGSEGDPEAGYATGKAAFGSRSAKVAAAAEAGPAGGRGLRFAAAEEDDEQEGWHQAGKAPDSQQRKGLSSGRFGKDAQLAASETEADGMEGGWEDGSEAPAGARGHAQWEQLRSPMQSGNGRQGMQSSMPESQGRGKPGGRRSSLQFAPEDADGDDEQGAGSHAPRGISQQALLTMAEGEDGRGGVDRGPGGDDAASDGGSEDEGSKLDIGSASEAGDGDYGEDIACDWRYGVVPRAEHYRLQQLGCASRHRI